MNGTLLFGVVGLLSSLSFTFFGLQASAGLPETQGGKEIELSLETLQGNLRNLIDHHGRVTPELQQAFYELEDRYASRWDENIQARFQSMVAEVGGKMKSPIRLPADQTPFWFLKPGELHHYRSSKTLPKTADYVIIGAGLTGTSAAYHLAPEVANGKTVVVLEAGHPASQSSGRNGGNFQLLSESYVGNYQGLVEERVKSLLKTRPELSPEERSKLAEQQAKALVQFSLKNFHRFRGLVAREKIECNFSEQGWLRIAGTQEEEQALLRDVKWLQDLNHDEMPEMEVWSAAKIAEKTGIQGPHVGRYIAKNGNYHPYKFVTEVLKKTIHKGVSLYTGVKVESVTPKGNQVLIKTPEGEILAQKVIVATNAQTPLLFPQLKAIQTVPSQVMNLEHVKNKLMGMTLTERGGDLYYNFPASKTYVTEDGTRRGMVHFGLDFDHPSESSTHIPRSEELFREMKAMTEERFPDTKGQPPTRVWTGPMAFTDDRVPVIGFMESKNIIIAAAFQGYGGSYCTQAGYVASEMARTGQVHPMVPEEMFSPLRFKK